MTITGQSGTFQLGPGQWVLELGARHPDCLCSLRVCGNRGALSVPLPCPPGTTLLALTVTDGPVRVALDGDLRGTTMDVRPRSVWHRLWPFGRDRVLAAMALPVGGAVLSPLSHRPLAGGRSAWKRWRRSLRVMYDLGLLAASPGGQRAAADAAPVAEARVGAHLHLFYPDLWPDCATALASLPSGSRLHITGPVLPEVVVRAIHSSFPAATLHVAENAGYDVWPFVKLLGEGAFDGLDIVLKLHGKKSLHPGLLPCVGDLWRRAAFDDLAANPAVVAAAVARFATDSDLGMLGPARLRVPNDHYDEAAAWGTNRAQTLTVAARLGLVPGDVQLDYFAGTMFWVRPAMLELLRAADLRVNDFVWGGLATDGGLSHALERLFPALVKAAGGRVEDVPPSA